MEDNGSLYDQFSSHDAPTPHKKPLVREQNWQSAEEVNKRYKENLPAHVKEAMTVTQKDLSYYAFNRFALGHPVRDSFEHEVNKLFGKLTQPFDFKLERAKYIKLYKQHMEK